MRLPTCPTEWVFFLLCTERTECMGWAVCQPCRMDSSAISIPELSPCSAVEPEGSNAAGLGTAKVSRALMEVGTEKVTLGYLKRENSSVVAESDHGKAIGLRLWGNNQSPISSQSKYFKMPINGTCSKTCFKIPGRFLSLISPKGFPGFLGFAGDTNSCDCFIHENEIAIK